MQAHQEDTIEEELECPKCGANMHEDWDNVGFNPPEGCPHYEVVGYYCPVCGYRENL
jgi:ssDNA-binding Zn-finger/Zn-ribbon topoisomerase 1